MANYKVIQDIEAEDKLVGPLTLRQFIYAAVAAICGYLSIWAVGKGLSLALIIFLPPMLFAGFFAFPWGRDQSTEVWALAKLRFYLKSRRRLWDQTGVKDLVTITAPKREVIQRTNGLSVNEVQSRLTALASTLDTRGWAIKNVTNIPPIINQKAGDRLLDINAMPREVPTMGLSAADDILDEMHNPRAQQLSEMVATATAARKQHLLDEMRRGTAAALPAPKVPSADFWFTPPKQPVAPNVTAANDAQLAAVLHEQHIEAVEASPIEHLKTIQPLTAAPPAPAVQSAARPTQTSVTSVTNVATMRLANNNDLNISTIAREANRENGSGEVVISLHRRK